MIGPRRDGCGEAPKASIRGMFKAAILLSLAGIQVEEVRVALNILRNDILVAEFESIKKVLGRCCQSLLPVAI